MAEDGCGVLFLTDRLGGPAEVRTFRGLLGRLGRLGYSPRVICRSAAGDHRIPGLIESPNLGRRWLLPWATRGLDLGQGPARPRILHVLGMGMAEAGLEIAERWRLPYLLTVDEFPRRDFRIRLSRAWCRGLVATNGELAEALVRDFGIPARSLREIPRGISETVGPTTLAGEGRVPGVGAAGPLVAGSGFPTFLAAARRVVDDGLDAEFLIAGQGDDEADLRRRAERLRIADRLTFADDWSVGPTFWDALDVFCQTSVASTTGRTLVLAMAHGVPSVASDLEGLRGMIRHGETGIRIPPGDAPSLARAIAGLLADRDRARALGQAGREAALANHHPDREAERLDGLYREVIANGLDPLASSPIGPPREAVEGEGRPIGGADRAPRLGTES